MIDWPYCFEHVVRQYIMVDAYGRTKLLTHCWGMKARKRRRMGLEAHSLLQGYSSDLRPPIRLHPLKVPSPPNSTTGWGPSLQHVGF